MLRELQEILDKGFECLEYYWEEDNLVIEICKEELDCYSNEELEKYEELMNFFEKNAKTSKCDAFGYESYEFNDFTVEIVNILND